MRLDEIKTEEDLKEMGKTSFKDFIDMGFTSAEEFATLLLDDEVQIILNVVSEKIKKQEGWQMRPLLTINSERGL